MENKQFPRKDIQEVLKMSHDEYQQYWLGLLREDAETNQYDAELLKTITRIIDEKDYSHLFYSFQSYDRVVKALEKNNITDIPAIKDGDLPFWCYALSREGLECEIPTDNQNEPNET